MHSLRDLINCKLQGNNIHGPIPTFFAGMKKLEKLTFYEFPINGKPQITKEMFLLIQNYYNPTNSIEKAIRSWNGGVNYSVRATNRYFQKVMNILK